MAVIGTFGSFTTARLGIYASQASLQVTGNNIANINTRGYTRQRADLVSLNSTGTSKYANPMGVDIGYGVLVRSTTQLRDPYLDIRFRNQNTQLGEVNATLAGLNKIAQTLDEVNKGGESQNGVIENAFQNLKTMLEGLSDAVGSEEQDGLVREAAKSLITFFNTAAEDLQKDWDLQADELRDTVKDVNRCLINIRDLNEQIRKQGIYGDQALELRDARNLYIDELSEYLHINVEYSLEQIDQYTSVEKLTISLADTKDPRTNQPIKLIDGLFGAQLSLSELDVNPQYNAAEPQTLRLNPKYDPNAKVETDPGFFMYLDEKGNPTNDPELADRVKLNPAYSACAKEAVRNPGAVAATNENGEYVNEKGEVVDDPDDALWVKPNPNYEENGTTDLTRFKYLKKDGSGTNSIDEAVKAARYLDEDGNPTDDPELAVYRRVNSRYDPDELKIAVPNGDFDEANAVPLEYPADSGMYLDENGQPTDDKTKAALVRLNPDYSETAATEPEKFKYLKADGTGTDDIREAAVTGQFLDEDGNPTNDPARANYVKQNSASVDDDTKPPYLDAKGRPTRDIEKAAPASRKYLDDNGKQTNYAERAAEAPRKYLDKNGDTTNYIERAGAASRKYISADGGTTNVASKAAKVDPDKFLFQVERLEDKFGRPLDRGLNNEAEKRFESVVVPLSDNDLAGSIQAMRELLTEEGEFASGKDLGIGTLSSAEKRGADPNANIKKGIPYYQKRLDLLAQKFAEVFNEANQLPASTAYVNDGTNFQDSNQAVIKDANGHAIELDDVTVEIDGERVALMDTKQVRDALKAQGMSNTKIDQKIADSAKYLEVLRDQGVISEAYGHYDGGVLFSNGGNSNDPTNITASNISISHGWASRVVRVLNRTQPNEVANDGSIIDHSSDNSNILHMINLFEAQLEYSASELEPDAAGGAKVFFHGSFQEMYTDLGATLGSQQSTIMGVASNYEIMTLDLDNDRSSVSGVDLNEEATSMMQFQKSYQAACRLLTTIDSMLDTLINGTLR